MTGQSTTTAASVRCPDRQHICERPTCCSLGCQSPFSQIEKLADNIAHAVTRGATRTEIRDALVEFADEIKRSVIEP